MSFSAQAPIFSEAGVGASGDLLKLVEQVWGEA